MKDLKFAILAISLLFFTNASFAKNSITASDSIDLTEYAGKYKYQTGPIEFLNFSIKEGILVAFAEGYPETVLYRKSRDVFEDRVYGAVFKFSRTNEKISKVTLEVNGLELVAIKTEEEKR